MRRVLALGLMAMLGTVVVGLAEARKPRKPVTIYAIVPLHGAADSGVEGLAVFRQRGQRITGRVFLAGLAPNTTHAVHFHAPGQCGGPAADPIAAHADVVADASGIVSQTISTGSALRILKRGVYYNVHAQPTTAGRSGEIACGNVVPDR